MSTKHPELVSEGVWFFEAPLNGVNVAIYILKGEKTAIIDTGYSYHPEKNIIPAINELGFNANDIDMILNTHGHPDHLGGNAKLAKLTGASIYLHEKDTQLSAGPDAHINSNTDHILAMRELGWQDQVTEREKYIRERVDACQVDHVLHDGEIIELGSGLTLEVVPTPGHSAGSVTFYIRDKKIAFSGDAVMGWGIQEGIIPLYYFPEDYFKSLNRVESFDLELLCLGHNVRWSGSGSHSSAVRKGEGVRRTIEDSKRFFIELAELSAKVDHALPLSEKVATIAKELKDPYQVLFDSQGRIPASSATTIISQLENPYKPSFD